eukprot:3698792-Pleurochrysis_carterae.AAC.4
MELSCATGSDRSSERRRRERCIGTSNAYMGRVCTNVRLRSACGRARLARALAHLVSRDAPLADVGGIGGLERRLEGARQHAQHQRDSVELLGGLRVGVARDADHVAVAAERVVQRVQRQSVAEAAAVLARVADHHTARPRVADALYQCRERDVLRERALQDPAIDADELSFRIAGQPLELLVHVAVRQARPRHVDEDHRLRHKETGGSSTTRTPKCGRGCSEALRWNGSAHMIC